LDDLNKQKADEHEQRKRERALILKETQNKEIQQDPETIKEKERLAIETTEKKE
jgi:hypothetical protein